MISTDTQWLDDFNRDAVAGMISTDAQWLKFSTDTQWLE